MLGRQSKKYYYFFSTATYMWSLQVVTKRSTAACNRLLRHLGLGLSCASAPGPERKRISMGWTACHTTPGCASVWISMRMWHFREERDRHFEIYLRLNTSQTRGGAGFRTTRLGLALAWPGGLPRQKREISLIMHRRPAFCRLSC